MRVAIYSRVSTMNHGQDSENQARLLRQYCADNGYTIIAEITETISGGKRIEERKEPLTGTTCRKVFCIYKNNIQVGKW